MARWTLAVLALVALCAALCVAAVAGSPVYDIDDEALLAEVTGQPLPTTNARARVESLMSFDDLPADALALLEETAHDNPIAASLVNKQKDAPTEKSNESTEKKEEKSSDKSTSDKSEKSEKKQKKSKRGESKRTEKEDKKAESKDEKKSAKKDDAKVDEKQATNSTATASAEQKQANPVAPVAASDNAVLNATGPVKGIDNWTVVKGRGVYSAPTGVVIGTIPAKAELVIEYYAYEPSVKDNSTGRSSDETLWGWGYVTSPEGFGGWAGENACGFFPLQRRSGSDLTGPLTLEATRGQNVPNHPAKCPKMDDANKQLQREKILKQGSFLKNGGLVKAITSKTCQTHTNYDPAMKSSHGPSIPIEAGTYSGGSLPVGTVPTSTPQKKMVENFGLRYVTKDGKMALVSYPLLDPAQPGLSDFFVPLDCIEFDAAAITNANKLYVPKAAPSVVAKAQAKAKKAAAEAKAKATKAEKLKKEEAALKKKREQRLKKHRKGKKSKKHSKSSKKGKSSKKKHGKHGKHEENADAEEHGSKKSKSSKHAKGSKGKKSKGHNSDEEEESSSKKNKSSNKKDSKKSSKKENTDDEEEDNKKGGKGKKSKAATDSDEHENKNERKARNHRAQSSFLETEAEAEDDAEQEDAAESESDADAEEEEESSFDDDAALMEVAASTHASLSNDGPRGDYPGWSEMLLEESASAQVAPVAPVAAASAPLAAMAAPALMPAPMMQAAPAPVPAAAAPASTIKLGETQTEAVLKNASVGIKKVNVHVYGQADPSADAEKEQRLQNMVQRLAHNQSESYKKINDLLRKLKACGAENKACIAQLTEKLEDWKQENVAPK